MRGRGGMRENLKQAMNKSMKTKPTVGEILIAEIPAARFSEKKIHSATVTKVGRKYFSARFDGQHHEYEFIIETWRQSDYNANVNRPIYLYRTNREMEDRHEKNAIVKSMTEKFRYSSDWDKLDINQLRSISEIIGF